MYFILPLTVCSTICFLLYLLFALLNHIWTNPSCERTLSGCIISVSTLQNVSMAILVIGLCISFLYFVIVAFKVASKRSRRVAPLNGELIELENMSRVLRNGARAVEGVPSDEEKLKILGRLLPIIKSEWRLFFSDFKVHYPQMYKDSKDIDRNNYVDLKWAIMRVSGKDFCPYALHNAQAIILSINDRIEQYASLGFETKSRLFDVVSQCKKALFSC